MRVIIFIGLKIVELFAGAAVILGVYGLGRWDPAKLGDGMDECAFSYFVCGLGHILFTVIAVCAILFVWFGGKAWISHNWKLSKKLTKLSPKSANINQKAGV